MKKHLARILFLAMLLGMMTVGSLAADSYSQLTVKLDLGNGYAVTLDFDAAYQEQRTLTFEGVDGPTPYSTQATLVTVKPGSSVTLTGFDGKPDNRSLYGYYDVNSVYVVENIAVYEAISGKVDYWFSQGGNVTLVQMPSAYGALYFKLGDDGGGTPAAPTSKTGEKLDSWAKALVDQAIDAKLMPQHLSGADLTKNISRTQFAALTVSLYEAMSGTSIIDPGTQNNPFEDTADTAVLKAYSMGFTSGVSDKRFGADEPLTREAAATMLCAVYKALDGKISSDSASAFADDSSISSWAKSNVYFMAQNGIIAGVGSNTFDPGSMAQSQAALIMALRMFQNLK